MRALSSVAGFSMSIERYCRLNGSCFDVRRCRVITGRSIITPLGSSTGSVIRVFIRGSEGSKSQF